MQILVIADDDVVLSSVPEQRCDVLVSCGDLPDEIILKVAERVRCRRILAVKGNHDSSGAFHPRITDLHLQTVSIDGITFGGFGGSWKYKPKGHFLYEQQEVDAALESFPRVDVFVAHNSPNGIHDQADDVHIGFNAFVSYILDKHPKLFLHGHQHKNQRTIYAGTKVLGVYGHRTLVLDEKGEMAF